jgi:hypothetical protein
LTGAVIRAAVVPRDSRIKLLAQLIAKLDGRHAYRCREPRINGLAILMLSEVSGVMKEVEELIG